MPTPGKLRNKHLQKKVQALAAAGVPQADIARNVGVHQSSIHRYLERAVPELQALKPMMEHRADLLARQQALSQAVSDKIIRSMAEDDISALSPEAKARCLVPLMAVQDRAHQQERLERGQSTANIHSLVEQASRRLADIDRELAELDQS